MQDSYKSSEPSLRPQGEETEEKIVGEYRMPTPPAEPLPIPANGAPLTPDEPDYEKLFVRDAIRRTHDEELAALASLAMIRSGSDGRGQMLTDLGAENTSHLKKPKETLEQIISEADR